jgi:hypothetical protein
MLLIRIRNVVYSCTTRNTSVILIRFLLSVKSINYEAPHYVIFSLHLLFRTISTVSHSHVFQYKFFSYYDTI